MLLLKALNLGSNVVFRVQSLIVPCPRFDAPSGRLMLMQCRANLDLYTTVRLACHFHCDAALTVVSDFGVDLESVMLFWKGWDGRGDAPHHKPHKSNCLA